MVTPYPYLNLNYWMQYTNQLQYTIQHDNDELEQKEDYELEQEEEEEDESEQEEEDRDYYEDFTTIGISMINLSRNLCARLD